MNNDAISTTVTSIRNANTKRKAMTRIPVTKMTRGIVQILLEEGFLKSVTEHTEGGKIFMDVKLRYFGKEKKPYVATIRYISKPGLRIYCDHIRIPKILGGMGIAILSTSYGLITDREARRRKTGGEILCHIW
uniref:Small ribosomal subunit protein uS8c n=1 Tax=Adiantum capillus-veneris TaxID=13818 RepID=RR8_ADICA|nr:ribosomal protein S8 [Adiantum capillus-veneris]Q85FI7.2 RecName: Full=Small ribosomal subunit protein uS8c; AltName: Full=30S ribosomal protein S8, chloroplastic [Adiantum capillus-veneris]AAP29426.2 ribosomal protein S8 [Adiantum capillus-veneris]